MILVLLVNKVYFSIQSSEGGLFRGVNNPLGKNLKKSLKIPKKILINP